MADLENFNLFDWMERNELNRIHYKRNAVSNIAIKFNPKVEIKYNMMNKNVIEDILEPCVLNHHVLLNFEKFLASQEHEEILFSCYPEIKLYSAIAIHDRTLAIPLPHISDEKAGGGGCRFLNYSSFKEFLNDVLVLPVAMTLKLALNEINLVGGAKSVAWTLEPKNKSHPFLKQHALEIDSFEGRFIGAEDMNCEEKDIEIMALYTRYVVGRSGISKIYDRNGKHFGNGSGNPAPITAIGGIYSLKGCFAFAELNDCLYDKKCVIQGYGAVGKEIVSILKTKGVSPENLCVTDNDAKEIDFLKNYKGGITFLEPGTEYDEECDVFIPCAKGGVLNQKTIPRLKCKIVIPIANNAFANPEEDGKELFERKIICPPDPIANAGGAINAFNELRPSGYCRDEVLKEVAKIKARTFNVLSLSRKLNKSPHEIALALAEAKIEMKQKLN